MTARRNPPLLEKRGAHLYQLGVNEWAIYGEVATRIKRVETIGADGRLSIGWEVTAANRPRGRWGTAALALAQAYGFATGKQDI